MKHTLLAAFLVLCVAPATLGQTEKITLYADAAGTECSITDTGPGVVAVHMYHIGSGVRNVSHFSAPLPACWTGAVWLGDVLPPASLFIGTTQTDFTVGYIAGVPCGESIQLPYYIGKINYYATGAGQPCCEYPVLPAPTTEVPGSVITVNCDPPPFGSILAIGAGKVTINPTAECACLLPLAVKESSWGQVKALYR